MRVVEVDFGSHKSMEPKGVDLERMAEESDHPFRICASEENHAATKWRLKIQAPPGREPAALRRRLDPAGRPQTVSFGVPIGAILEFLERPVVETAPDSCLPSSIEALNGGLKSGLAGW